MERMSTLDAGFYLVDHEYVPMHLGSVAVFDGPAPSLARLTGYYVTRLSGLPRYRQRVVTSPLNLTRPAWDDDPSFDIRYHVRSVRVPVPGGQARLSELAADLFARPLDMSRPLWEVWLLRGLAGGQWAVLSKVHHCMVDGIGGSDLMTAVFGQDRVPAPGQPAVPGDPAVPGGVAGPAPARRIASSVGRVAALAGTLARNPDAARAGLWAYGTGLAGATRRLTAVSASSLNGPAGPRRRWAVTEASLADLRRIRSQLGGTVNDVLLAAIAGSLRDCVPGLGPDVVVRTLVPVSIRALGDDRGGNQLSAVLVNLPAGEPEPLRRLENIRAQTDELKRTYQAAGPQLITALLGRVASPVLAPALRAAFRLPQPLVQIVTTNVPGPRELLTALGRPMVAVYPYGPIGGNVRLSVAMYSYLGTVYLGVTADYDEAPDLEKLTGGIDRELAVLTDLAGLS
jgi:diacylglycerol O-acyltransferase / wax synthase